MFILRNQFHMAFFATAVVISITVLLFTLLQKRIDRPQNRWFLILIFIVIINSVSELITAVIEPLDSNMPYYYGGLIVSQNLYFTIHAALCPALFDYVSCVIGDDRRRSIKDTLLLHIPFFVTELLALLNPIFHWVFYYDSQYNFHRSWAEYLIYWAAAFYFMLSVVDLLFSWRAITPRRSIALTYFFVLTFSGVLIQLINIDIKSELLCESLSLMGAMLAIESEDDRLDVDTLIYNRRALQMDIHNILSMNENANVIFVKMINTKIVERVTRSANNDILAISCADYLKTLVPRYRIYHPNGETFVIFCKPEQDINELKNKIEQRFADSWRIYDNSFKLDAIVLGARIPKDVKTIEDFIYITDSIIPQGVAQNHAEIEWLMRKAEIERAIRSSLLTGCFEVRYQPTVRADNERIHGAEALVRMNDENLGAISPEEFIPIAEQIGLVDEIDDFVLREVCEFIQSGIPSKHNLDCINVNLSVIQCLKPGFFQHILNIVDSYKVDHSLINFEITESVGAEDYEALSFIAHQLKAAGFSLSMDDYGTGYSNMEGIFALDFDVVKIDKIILWSAENEFRGRVILENSVRMIHDLGCKVLVEGVETSAQMEMLKKLGVDYFQGFYFSKPITKSDFIEYLTI